MEIRTESRRQSRPLRYLVNLVSVTLTLFAAGFIVPMAFGLERYVITGTSMTGSYDVGSLVFEDVVPVSDLQVGDVITYLPPPDSGVTNLVTHRIVSIKGGVFRTKGDAVEKADPWRFRPGGSTQPRVVFSVPKVGHAFIALEDRSVRMALIGVPAGLVALLSLVQVLGALRRCPGQPEDTVRVIDPVRAETTPVSVSKPTVSVGG